MLILTPFQNSIAKYLDNLFPSILDSIVIRMDEKEIRSLT